LAASACCSCASVPVHYYSLMAPAQGTRLGTTETCCNIDIPIVKIPAEVERPELVVRRSDDELAVLGNDLWIAPLHDELKSALLEQIRRTLADTGGAHRESRKVVVRVDVERFESVLERYALVQIAWRATMSAPPNELTAACQTTAKIEVGAGVPELVRGQQRAVAQVGEQIASAIIALEKSGTAQCPDHG
jgi:uncharacterized protein